MKIRAVVFSAVLAGLLVGVLTSILQINTVIPLILEAERYEQISPAQHHDHAAAHDHHHDEAGWTPREGFERHFYTIVTNTLSAIGFALLLGIAWLYFNISHWKHGLWWGLAGFVVFQLAPSLGLPPELPGMPAGDLEARQSWWLMTALATAAGLGMLAFKKGLNWRLLGLALLITPHVIGAPQPENHLSAVPGELWLQFAMLTLSIGALFWLTLGASMAYLQQRFTGSAQNHINPA